MAAAYELEGAFNHLILDLRPEAEPKAVIEAVDQALRPYGGTGAYGRMDYPSHSFLEAEFQGLAAMAGTLPPIFLGVATFLLNVLLGRTIELDRESIGLLKALGYRRMEVAGHYLKLVGILVVAGILLGFALGDFVGHGVYRSLRRLLPFSLPCVSVRARCLCGGRPRSRLCCRTCSRYPHRPWRCAPAAEGLQPRDSGASPGTP